jgi:phage tail sheath protein FI
MATDFLHGVEVVTVEGGPRPIQTIRSAIIGLVGTAPLADAAKFPLNKPVLVTSRGGYAGIGATGTLAKALAGIYEQFSPFVVVIRVEEGADAAETMANVVGGVDVVSGARTGVQAFRDAQTETGVSPMILVAPEFTSDRPIGLASITLTAQGAGYTAAPAVAITGGGAAADKVLPTAEAVLGTGAAAGKVTAIRILTHGANLTDTLAVAFTGGGGGAGAAATASVDHYKNPVAGALESVASGLRAHCVVAASNTTDADAIQYRGDFGNRRIYIVDPFVKVFDTAAADYVSEDPSARIAGLIARIDAEQGFWKSPSNELIYGIGGLDRPIDYALGDPNTRANLLNENEIATIIRDDGYRLWGNRTASDDPLFAFLCVSRTADMIDLSVQRAHRWACDKGITRGYLDDVTSAVNGYLRYLTALGAIIGGRCYVDPDLNPVNEIKNGHVTFSYEFTPTYPAERVTFRSSITDEFIAALFA